MKAGSLLVFADDWSRHPSSCQHLVGRLLDEFSVCWVNTIGTRRPRLDLLTFRRALEKAQHWIGQRGSAKQTDARLQVVSPLMWPSFGSHRARAINRSLLLRQLVPIACQLPRPITCVTTIPLIAPLVGLLPVDRWVYYCVDDFSEWPGLDQASLAESEKQLLQNVDVVVAVSRHLVDRIRAEGRAASLLTHGVDLDFWRTSPGAPTMVPRTLGECERPYVVFWGVIDRRMDVDWIAALADRLDRGTIVLAGPQQHADPALTTMQRVHMAGPVDFSLLPALAEEASALIMPYRDAPVTRAMQPLKLKEYLATNRPVVVRRLPSVVEWADCLDAVDAPDDFARVVMHRVGAGLPVQQAQARARLADESWDAKARRFAAVLASDAPNAVPA